MPMIYKPNSRKSRAPDQQTNIAKRFMQDEDGSILIMTILLLVTMLIMGGMAVDFMRFESRRAEIQGVADRAVLSAANLNQTLPPREIVTDHFEKAGYADSLVDIPIATVTPIERTVQVDAQVDVRTFFLKLAGIDELSAPAYSRAIEGAGEVEVSLVLDISGSMGTIAVDNREQILDAPWQPGACDAAGLEVIPYYYQGYGWVYYCMSGEAFTRLDLLKVAASNFATTILGINGDPTEANYAPTVSMSLVNYSSHVNIGDELFEAINVNATTSVDPDEKLPDFVNPSRCVDFENFEYNTTVFNKNREYNQVEYIDYNSGSNVSEIGTTLCPNGAEEGIIPLADQAGNANTSGTILGSIASLQPRLNTSIHIGMKWGVSLLDPSMQSTIADLDSVHENFSGSRPLDYADEGDRPTVKYVVIITDGENFASERVRPHRYDSFYEQYALLQHPRKYLANSNNANNNTSDFDWNSGDFGSNTVLYTPATASNFDSWLSQTCARAKEQDIIVYAIAMDAPSAGQTAMKDCASEPTSRFYKESEGSAIDSIFQDIASQITDLRLNL